MGAFNLLFFLISTLLPILMHSTQIDSSMLTTNQTIRDGEAISSAGGSFELGFFSPGSSKNRYLGIWYKKISHGTVVWVANRAIPITDTSRVLKLHSSGILVLSNSTYNVVWSTNTSTSPSYPVAQLLDSGNLVVRDGINDTDSSENFLWLSFDYPGDTLLPDMKFGKNFVSGLDSYLSSWTSPDDPSPGNFTNRFGTNGYPQIFLRRGSEIQFRSGPWNGLRFSGMPPNLKPNPVYTIKLVYNPEVEVYYEYQLVNSSVVSRMVLSSNGLLQRFIWINRTQGWMLYLTAQMDDCDRYALCGPYGSCNINNSPACGCLTGFEPKFPHEWDVSDWSSGCVRRTQLACGNGDGFLKYPGVKLPDTRQSWFSESMDLEECKRACLSNCSCAAYSNLDIRDGGSGCLIWFGNLVDTRQYAENGQDLYVRMAASELGSSPVPQDGSNGKKRETMIIMLASLTGAFLIALSMTFYVHKKKKRLRQQQQQQQTQIEVGRAEPDSVRYTDESKKEELELPWFDFTTVANATNYFSINNKLGEGGFGPVYKGMLETGQEIAVKRLSKESRQGNDEFTNEVRCIAKLQHRNLVRLLGYCIQGEEKILIYEYMPNGSLDSFIFDQTQSKTLDWPERFRIISGIARGLLYLHQDSRLRVIHRDLKASNVLLDFDMNPKISDFGTARSFGGNETQANTNRVIGTHGYMSPEYMVDGLFSVKSDVFSFGVLMLEIISGRKNRRFSHPDHKLNLLGHAWRLYNEGRSLELVDAPLGDSAGRTDEVLRAIHVGLLCVQQSPEDRPSMSTVVPMLGSDASLPPPKQPGFFTERNVIEGECSSSNYAASSANEVTITLLDPR